MRQAVSSSIRGVPLLDCAFWIEKRERETDNDETEDENMRLAVPSSIRGVTLLDRAFWMKKRDRETDKRRKEGRKHATSSTIEHRFVVANGFTARL